ncbi:MAG: mononuclear molybdenum enzyme YedY, partial [Nitratireductor sp.]
MVNNFPKIPSSLITPKDVWLNRRSLLAGAGAVAMMPALGTEAMAKLGDLPKLETTKTDFGKDLKPTAYDYVTGYNNYYEFGTGKEDPAANAHTLTTKPWTVKIDGLVNKPGDY